MPSRSCDGADVRGRIGVLRDGRADRPPKNVYTTPRKIENNLYNQPNTAEEKPATDLANTPDPIAIAMDTKNDRGPCPVMAAVCHSGPVVGIPYWTLQRQDRSEGERRARHGHPRPTEETNLCIDLQNSLEELCQSTVSSLSRFVGEG